jgi:hypothetical protein
MLLAADLTRMRAVQALTFDLTATITRPSGGTDDGAGGRLPTSPATSTSPCRLAPHRGEKGEEVVAGAIQGMNQWDITFPALTDVQSKDRITIGTKSYEVISLRAPSSRETARTVLCVER